MHIQNKDHTNKDHTKNQIKFTKMHIQNKQHK